ncbi:endonuclease/exonuclease/phosphatase family protein [Modestobacter sp. NPDC049651]|uniref:endonuclease/exonuclease/phosphatase family protein n=1 Tax=unclassified Modestobacter TaxID=2643866 RepID=UPI003408FFC6
MRLATFNILHGRSPADDQVDVGRFAAAVKSLDADVLALQEVDRDQPRSHLADLTAVAGHAMGAVDSQFAAAIAGTPGATWTAATGKEHPGTAAYGIALLSRYPVRQWQVVRLPAIPFRFPMWLPGPRKVIVVDEEPRVALVAVLETPHGRLTVVTTHLSFVPGWNRLQLRRLRRDLAGYPGPLVLMGDLNMTPPTPAAVTGWRPIASGPTFPVEQPDRQLDHVLLRGELGTVTATSAPDLGLSDHRALTVDLDR